jgi:hypothetical protein
MRTAKHFMRLAKTESKTGPTLSMLSARRERKIASDASKTKK